MTCGLWRSYFVTAEPLLDDAIRRRDQADRTHLARDVYSILHFVVVFGVVLLAVAVEEAVAHPHEALPAGGSLALAGGVVLFVGGTAAALRRSGNALSGRQLVILGAVTLCLAHPRRSGHLVAARGGPRTPPAGRGGASDRESVEASLSAAPSPARPP